MEKISPKIVKDIEKSWFWSRSQDFCQFLEGFGFGLEEYSLGKKSWFWFWKIWYQKKLLVSLWEIWSRKKVLVSVLVSKKSLGFGKKVLISVSIKILVPSFSAWRCSTSRRVDRNPESARSSSCISIHRM